MRKASAFSLDSWPRNDKVLGLRGSRKERTAISAVCRLGRLDLLIQLIQSFSELCELRTQGLRNSGALRKRFAKLRYAQGQGEQRLHSHRAIGSRPIVCERALSQSDDFAEFLDEATKNFIGEVSPLFNLGKLRRYLTGQEQLVVKADGALHGIPLAHLQLADGQSLFEAVRSVRSSFTLGLDVLQKRLVGTVKEGQNRILASAAWFPDGEPTWRGAVDLLAGQAYLAEKYNLDWRTAAQRPLCTMAQLAALIREGSVIALVLNAHGTETAGALLADGVLHGVEVDFSEVGIVILICCSLGQVRENELRDASGFAVNMLLSRAQSVVGASWPVQCQLAADFGNEVTRQYLDQLANHGMPARGAGALRAEAVNRARMKLLSEDTPGMLNTVAAFGLFGLP